MITRDFNLVIRVPQQDYIDTGIDVVQNDQNVYTLNLRITDGISDIDYTQVDSATITFAKQDGHVVQGNLVATDAGFTYEMGTNEIAYPGKVIASIQLYGDIDERLTTARFSFKVVQDLITPAAVQSTSEFPLLQKLLQDIEQLKTDIVNLEVSDGALLDVKLSDAAGQIKDKVTTLQTKVTTHKAETASKHITESGSNTNGNYIKYDDGTMICYRTLVAGSRIAFGAGTLADPYRTLGFTWTFPASFNGIPVLCLTARIESSDTVVRANSCAFHSIDNVGATQIQSIMLSSNSTAADVFINCIAIGRWKV